MTLIEKRLEKIYAPNTSFQQNPPQQRCLFGNRSNIFVNKVPQKNIIIKNPYFLSYSFVNGGTKLISILLPYHDTTLNNLVRKKFSRQSKNNSVPQRIN